MDNGPLCMRVYSTTSFGITLHWPLLLGLLVPMSLPGRIRPAFPLLLQLFPAMKWCGWTGIQATSRGKQDRGRACGKGESLGRFPCVCKCACGNYSQTRHLLETDDVSAFEPHHRGERGERTFFVQISGVGQD
jgi:hypothetical protein